MQLEDDYGMIDGVINNGPKQTEKPTPAKEETKAKKPSVLAKLRKYQAEDRQAATQHRSAERDLSLLTIKNGQKPSRFPMTSMPGARKKHESIAATKRIRVLSICL